MSLVVTTTTQAITDVYSPRVLPLPLRNALQQLHCCLFQFGLNFVIDSETGQLLVRVVDKITEEVLCQIPSEEARYLTKVLDAFKDRVFSTKMQYAVERHDRRWFVKIVDKETEAVVRQIPSEEIMHLSRILKEINAKSVAAKDNSASIARGSALGEINRLFA